MINQLLLRQMINEVLFTFDLVLVIILMRYIVVQGKQYASRLGQVHIQGAIALAIVLFGHVIVRVWSEATFVNISYGGGLFDLENAYPVALIGTIVTVGGLCWLIRVFAPSKWGDKIWVLSLALALVFVGLMRLVS